MKTETLFDDQHGDSNVRREASIYIQTLRSALIGSQSAFKITKEKDGKTTRVIIETNGESVKPVEEKPKPAASQKAPAKTVAKE